MMSDRIVDFFEPVTLLGGGTVAPDLLERTLARAPRLVAADGGANMALAHGHRPELVIGDYDSVSAATLAQVPSERQMHIPDQDTTDFEKCLMSLSAPLILGLGFTGPRADHTLAAFGALVRFAHIPCILIGEEDVIFACPEKIALALPGGLRFSLFPLCEVTGESRGLRWPIDGLTLRPDGRVATSNETTGPVELRLSGPGLLALLPHAGLEAAIRALG